MAIEAVERLPDISPFSRLNTPFLKPEIFSKSELRIGSLGNKEDIWKAGELVENEEVVVAGFRSVFGICARGDSDKALDRAFEMKSETDKEKPFSSMMSSRDFVQLIDLEVVSPPFRDLLKDGSRLQKIIGAMCHLRAPVKPSLVSEIPKRMLTLNKNDGRYYMQNFDPCGHSINTLIKQFNRRGIKYVAVTSFNNHFVNEPEITEFSRAEEFCRECGVKLLLQDHSPKREEIKGSFAIVNVADLSAPRDGNIPVVVLEEILGVKLGTENMKKAAYPQDSFPSFSDLGLSAELIRAGVISYLRGRRPDKIRERLRTVNSKLKK